MNNETLIAEGKKYLMNTYGRLPMVVTKGKGSVIWDADGKEYLDFVSGIAVNGLGHCHPAVVEAIQKQSEALIHCSNLYWIEPQIQLAKLLVEHSSLDKVFFCNSGAEANEGAIKLARKYAAEQGHPERTDIITMEHSFHGRTLATLKATGQEKFHKDFHPLPEGFSYVPFNDFAALKEAVTAKTCAIMLETVQGEGGVIAADPAYLQEVRALCDDCDILLILDEVQCGMGRTGSLFAYEQYGIEPDIMTLAKSLGGGAPIGAFLAKEQVAAAFHPGDHGSTFGGNPLVTAAGVAVMETMLEPGFLDHVQEVSSYLWIKLEALKEKYDDILEVRGKGLLAGLALAHNGSGIVGFAKDHGVLVNCTAGTVIRLLPPLTVTKEEIDKVVTVLDAAFSSRC
ncbi:MAG: acetylornithine transaminase [Peptococcaceae bacterium]|jgi:acetylornithine/N-succinyldiaminopimelate aminotransferase|nr:acetylornithine transaminase [Peptococcaceae bacterium]